MSASCFRRKQPSNSCRKDDGCGIEDDPSLLFKRFYRSDASRARNSGGAGLGLAIVKEIVESFDGTVTAFNAPRRRCRIRDGVSRPVAFRCRTDAPFWECIATK